jgi:hypothetical protein
MGPTSKERLEQALLVDEAERPLASTWRVYDNSSVGPARLVAEGGMQRPTHVLASATWKQIEGTVGA